MVYVNAELLPGAHSCNRSGPTHFSQRANSGSSAQWHKTAFGVTGCALRSRAFQRFSGRKRSVHFTAVDDFVFVLLVANKSHAAPSRESHTPQRKKKVIAMQSHHAQDTSKLVSRNKTHDPRDSHSKPAQQQNIKHHDTRPRTSRHRTANSGLLSSITTASAQSCAI